MTAEVCQCGHGEAAHYDKAGRCKGAGCACCLWWPSEPAMIRLCDVTLCFEVALVTVEDGYCFCRLHAEWYREYVAAGRPRDVRAWLHETHPETKP
jgi:hypothetical protein